MQFSAAEILSALPTTLDVSNKLGTIVIEFAAGGDEFEIQSRARSLDEFKSDATVYVRRPSTAFHPERREPYESGALTDVFKGAAGRIVLELVYEAWLAARA